VPAPFSSSRPVRSFLGARCLGAALALAAAVGLPASLFESKAQAQVLDLYDTTILRTINLQFHDTNWWTLLQQNYVSQTNILADLTMDGVTYPNVGVRIRGNTSYTALPAGSQKVSLNVEMDFVEVGQDLLGYSALNLNNGFHDATFCREVVYNNLVAQFMPNARANHVVVTLNGQNWGVYVNVQQYNKDLLRDYFADEDGLRIKCANNPNGPGLRYVGSSPTLYSAYEIKDDGGLTDPIGTLINVCDAVTNGSLTNWVEIDEVFAIDPSIWSVVLENLLTDDDSYVNKGCDFVTYRDPADGRMHLHQTDANETFTQATWTATRNFTAVNKPVLSHVLAVPELRQRYMAHYRTALARLNWAELEPIFTAHRTLIDAAVQADPKKLYSYTLFQANFTSTVNLPYPGPAGGSVIGLQQFVTQRASFLNGSAEVAAKGPTITNVQPSDDFPDADETVWITANVVPAAGGSISSVELFYLTQPGTYLRTTMLDNGLNNDGAAGDGVFGAVLPVDAAAGQRIKYYVAARSGNSFQSFSFEPALAENGPLLLDYSFGGSGVRITEYMYSGPSGEFVELTNTTQSPIDMTGWSMDDDSATAGVFSLSGAGQLDPGESLIITEANAATFSTAWGLSGITVLGGNTAANLGRNDQINIFDAGGNLVERLNYGDETYPGTIRTQNKSGQVCSQAIGQDDIATWVLAASGDAYGSIVATTGELGTPGTYLGVSCFPNCNGDLNGDATVDASDLAVLLGNWGGSGAGDIDGDGTVTAKDLASLLGAWGGCS
jgi:CotH kinase protein/Lamin Tail Domain